MIENDTSQKKLFTPKADYFFSDKNKNRYLDLTKKSTQVSSNINYENNITQNSNNYAEENKFKLQYYNAKKEEELNKSKKKEN